MLFGGEAEGITARHKMNVVGEGGVSKSEGWNGIS
jgi:hypothetical protein